MRCHKLPPVGISWQCGDQDTHFLTHTQIPLPTWQALMDLYPATAWLINTTPLLPNVRARTHTVWLVMTLTHGHIHRMTKATRISHSRLDLQAPRKLLSCSDIKSYVTRLTENKMKSETEKHVQFQNMYCNNKAVVQLQFIVDSLFQMSWIQPGKKALHSTAEESLSVWLTSLFPVIIQPYLEPSKLINPCSMYGKLWKSISFKC